MYKQIELPYDYEDTEPYIDAETMQIHYEKHHGTYTANLNDLAKKAGLCSKKICDLLEHTEEIEDEKLRMGIINNGGGFYNHNMYFEEIGPKGKKKPEGELLEAIEKTFGSFEAFKERISTVALNQFGSGWAWLLYTRDGNLIVTSTSNQNNPMTLGKSCIPLFNIDVWEHAYYLKYKNRRADYIKNFFEVVDWSVIEKRYKKALNCCKTDHMQTCKAEETKNCKTDDVKSCKKAGNEVCRTEVKG